MRAVVQRVRAASVLVGNQTVAKIDKGLVALLAVEKGDGPTEIGWMTDKLVGLRVFPDEQGKLNRDVREMGGGILLVSNFTVAGDASKGLRPSFDQAASSTEARSGYEQLRDRIATLGVPVATGQFGSEMLVAIENDGPVTLVLERRPTSLGK